MFKGSRYGYSRPSSTSSSIHHTSTRRGYSMSPRRLGSEETLFDGLVDVGNDKVDGSFSFFLLRPTVMAHRCTIQEAPVHDPFLVVQPSLNDSMLVKQGLVEETALPPPVHSAHDIQGPQGRCEETPPRVRPLSNPGTKTTLSRPKGRTTFVDTLTLSPNEVRTIDEQVREASETERGEVVVPFPPPAYTPYPPVGQGRRAGGV
ncbi:hypothetical protein BJY52DRAFT_1221070 [Lactarius psammicola]|nr:hypothetical protein BJY52DRAFT_1221070 [Lactarius psammicola]